MELAADRTDLRLLLEAPLDAGRSSPVERRSAELSHGERAVVRLVSSCCLLRSPWRRSSVRLWFSALSASRRLLRVLMLRSALTFLGDDIFSNFQKI